MPRATINGIGIEYEVHGDSGHPVILTPGGRFHMDTPGIRDFAVELAKGGRRAVIYDRPNCGKSDAYVGGLSESENQAEALTGLIRALDLGPTAIIGGSGGSRVSLLAGSRAPDRMRAKPCRQRENAGCHARPSTESASSTSSSATPARRRWH